MTNLSKVASVDTLALLEDPRRLAALMKNLGVTPNADADENLKRIAAAQGLSIAQYLKLKPVIRQWSCLTENFSNFEKRVTAVLNDHRQYIPIAPVWEEDLRQQKVTRKIFYFFEKTETFPVVEAEALTSPLLQVAAQIVSESLTGNVQLRPVVLNWGNNVIVDDDEKRFLLNPWRRAGLVHDRACPPHVLAGEFCFESIETKSDLERFGAIRFD